MKSGSFNLDTLIFYFVFWEDFVQTMRSPEVVHFLLSEAAQGRLSPLITVSGGTRSGKSYFSDELARALTAAGISATIVGLDDYFKDHDDETLPRTGEGSPIFDLHESYHRDYFFAQVNLLVAGISVQSPIYDKPTCSRLLHETRALKPAQVIIAEGLFAGTFLREHARALHIFVDTDKRLCLERRIAWDTEHYGITPEKVRDRFLRKVLPYWDKYILPQRNFSHIIIRN